MITQQQAMNLETVWFIGNVGQVVEYRVRSVHADSIGIHHVDCAYGNHHKQSRWIPCGDLFATSSEAYRESAARLRKQAAALLAEADRREREACAPKASDLYADSIRKAASPPGR